MIFLKIILFCFYNPENTNYNEKKMGSGPKYTTFFANGKGLRNTVNHLGSMKPEVAITKIAAWMRAVEDADSESRTMLRVDEDGRFDKAVWSFGHSAMFLRSVFVDATHLYFGPFFWCILSHNPKRN